MTLAVTINEKPDLLAFSVRLLCERINGFERRGAVARTSRRTILYRHNICIGSARVEMLKGASLPDTLAEICTGK